MKTYLKGVLYMSINNLSSFTKERLGLCIENDTIDNNLYEEYGVKRGLRDLNGIGINAGITNISLSRAYTMEDGKHTPADGELYYRGYEIRQLIDGFTKEIPNLLVAGEAAGGIHGRNRLMGNSLLDVIVFGRNAGKKAAAKCKNVELGEMNLDHIYKYADELDKADLHTDKVSPLLLPKYARHEQR